MNTKRLRILFAITCLSSIPLYIMTFTTLKYHDTSARFTLTARKTNARLLAATEDSMKKDEISIHESQPPSSLLKRPSSNSENPDGDPKIVTQASEKSKFSERTPDESLKIELQKRLREAAAKKTILLWYMHSEEGISSQINETECGNCRLTSNREMINHSSTAAILFHSSKISSETMPPRKLRNLDQLYIFWSIEPTPIVKYIHKLKFKYADEYGFNATMTYREDSDFYAGYRLWLWNMKWNETIIQHPHTILSAKDRLAVAVVSNCGFTAGAKLRMQLLNGIRDAGLKFDGFGNCFQQQNETEKIPRSSWTDLVKKLTAYKFFFAFENSYHCKDYVTEKVFRNAFYAYAIPVVWGARREDYEKLAPEGSYIFVEDFTSFEELVDYMKYLDKNDTAYLEYFRWHKSSRDMAYESNRAIKLCQICRAVHGINYDDIFNAKHKLSRYLFTDGIRRRTVGLEKYIYRIENEECLERDQEKLHLKILQR